MTVALPAAPRRPGRRAARFTVIEAKADVVTLAGADNLADGDAHAIYRRVNMALAAIRSAMTGQGCLTRVGAAYLGVPFRRRLIR